MTPNRAAVLAALTEQRCSAILRTSRRDAVRPALEAAIAGGFRILEITTNTPDCFEHIAALAERSGLVVGAGTVLSVDLAKEAMAAGARFLVSPVVDPAVLAFCRQHDLLSIPGTYTPSEMMAAHKAGADLVKLFPGPANGPAYVKACLGPMPFLRIFPTSGVSEHDAADWLAAGAFGVGFVGSLFEPQDLAASDFGAIRDRAARMIARVAAARPQARPAPAATAVAAAAAAAN